jgi:hypothetical protein
LLSVKLSCDLSACDVDPWRLVDDRSNHAWANKEDAGLFAGPNCSADR